jgi:hypothetical protein
MDRAVNGRDAVFRKDDDLSAGCARRIGKVAGDAVEVLPEVLRCEHDRDDDYDTQCGQLRPKVVRQAAARLPVFLHSHGASPQIPRIVRSRVLFQEGFEPPNLCEKGTTEIAMK